MTKQETLDLIEEYLLGHDFDVTTAMSGEQAIAIVQKDLFHIAIVDLHLPGMTGSELLKSMKKIRPDIQAVMITGYGTIRDAVECMKLGASDFITKPILLDHLHLTIQRILEEVRLKEEAELADYYRHLSRTDELTGMYNFRHLMSVLKNEVSRHLRYNRTMSLAMIDIDDFKQYNDAKGMKRVTKCSCAFPMCSSITRETATSLHVMAARSSLSSSPKPPLKRPWWCQSESAAR